MNRAAAAPPAGMPAARVLALGLVLPLLAGSACVTGFAPFYAWPVPILALAALFLVWSASATPRQAVLSGFSFGLGYFLAGVSWVFVSLHEFGSMPALLAALATFLFCAFLALYPALAGWIAVRFTPMGSGRRLALAAAAITLVDWLRGWVFTGFPWINLGTSQVPGSPLAGIAPVAGAYGLTLAVAGVAACIAGVLTLRRRVRWACAAGAVLLFGTGAALRGIEWTSPDGAPVEVALLQGNVSQHLKWRDEVRQRTLQDYHRMIVEARARIVVIPETALPAFFDELPAEYVEGLRRHAREANKEILLGTVEREFRGSAFAYYNSLLRITSTPPQSYRKRHLVPFGEYIPPGFQWILAVLKIPMSDFDKGAKRQAPLEAAGVRFGVAICYEDVFGEEVIDALPAAQALVNVSNDAWFGQSFAADQHLQASQVRALETGRWMVRSTNTGASAAIDPTGKVVARLPPFTVGTLLARIEPRSGMTPYARWGNAVALLLAALVALAALWRPRRRAA